MQAKKDKKRKRDEKKPRPANAIGDPPTNGRMFAGTPESRMIEHVMRDGFGSKQFAK